jgi:hypothetical protein
MNDHPAPVDCSTVEQSRQRNSGESRNPDFGRTAKTKHPALCSGWGDVDEPIFKTRPPLDHLFVSCHGFLLQFYTTFIDLRDQGHNWMFAFPSHVFGNLDCGLGIGEQRAIPILFQGSMGPFNGVVFAVVGRIASEPDVHPMLVGEIYGSFDKLRTPAAVFGTVVLIDHEC